MKIVQRSRVLLLCLLFSATVQAQTIPAGLRTALNHTLDSMRAVTGARSFSAAIQLADGALWSHADGISSVVPPAPVTTGDAYLIGSVTKTLTSACVLQLAGEGMLRLDDSLHTWLDTLPYISPDITIRQLLQHTSGLFDLLANPAHQDSMMADMSRVWTADELVARFMKPPLAAPGAGWAYCNTNYFLLSMIIREATGHPFYTEIRNRFFTPLGLSSFAIPAFETMNSPVAHLWLDINGDAVPDDAHDFYFHYLALNSAAGAAGGYYATPSDCSRWMRTYMRGDLLPAAIMTEARTTVAAAGSQGGLYGLGMMKNVFLGYEAYGHGGDLAYHASSWYFPALDISITVLTNDNNKNSWALLPVVTELLRTYLNYTTTTIMPSAYNGTALKAWPNPFTQQFTIDLPLNNSLKDITVSMKDVLGRAIEAFPVIQVAGQRCSILFEDLETLAPGLYFVTVRPGKGQATTLKIWKQA